jgi:hypothetical protein
LRSQVLGTCTKVQVAWGPQPWYDGCSPHVAWGVDKAVEVPVVSKRQLMAGDESGFYRAFFDELEDSEERYGVSFVVTLRKGKTKEDLVLHGEAFVADPVTGPTLVATADRAYPSPRVGTLPACLYQLAISLNVAVQHWHREQTGSFYSTPLD